MKQETDASGFKENEKTAKKTTDPLSASGRSRVAGIEISTKTQKPEVSADQDTPNPAQKGRNFENWARQELFGGNAKRITIYPEDNLHLDKLGDGVGLTKNRRIADAYWKEDGSLWELKSGYEKGGIDKDQQLEYELMQQAGHVNARVGKEKITLPVTSINYLFETEAGARANQSDETAFLFVDKNGKVKLLKS